MTRPRVKRWRPDVCSTGMAGTERDQDGTKAASSPPRAGDPFATSRNEAALLEAVRRAQVVARSELTHRVPYSQQSIHRLSEELVGKGLLRVLPPKISGRGKPSPRLALEPTGAYGVGVVIESDAAFVTVCDLVGNVLQHAPLAVEVNDPEAVAKASHAALERLIERMGVPRARVAGIGVSMQGFRLEPGTAFITPVPLSAWSDVDVVELFEAHAAFPVLAENDGTLGAVAELWVGAGRRFEDFAYLAFNYGFGGGLVLRGAPYLGHHLNAAELSALFDDEEVLRRPTLHTLLDMLREDGLDFATVADLRRAYDPAWPTLDRWVAYVAPALNQLLRALMAILDPAAIVFGGEAPVDLRRRLIAVSQRRVPDRLGRPVPTPALLQSAIGSDASALGAALFPIRHRLFAAANGGSGGSGAG